MDCVGLRYVGWSLLAGKQVQTRRSQRTGESSPKGGELQGRERKKNMYGRQNEGEWGGNRKGGVRKKNH